MGPAYHKRGLMSLGVPMESPCRLHPGGFTAGEAEAVVLANTVGSGKFWLRWGGRGDFKRSKLAKKWDPWEMVCICLYLHIFTY